MLEPQVAGREELGLGVLAPDLARTLLVISRSGELAVALRERLDRAYVLVRDVRPDEARAGVEACRPWPWMVAGDTGEIADPVLAAARRHPVLVAWLGELPAGLPGHARRCDSFAALADEITASLGRTVAGMRLSVGSGVVLPDGAHARSAELQALVASHPRELHLPLARFRSAARLLSSRRIPYRPGRGSQRFTVALRTVPRRPHA